MKMPGGKPNSYGGGGEENVQTYKPSILHENIYRLFNCIAELLSITPLRRLRLSQLSIILWEKNFFL